VDCSFDNKTHSFATIYVRVLIAVLPTQAKLSMNKILRASVLSLGLCMSSCVVIPRLAPETPTNSSAMAAATDSVHHQIEHAARVLRGYYQSKGSFPRSELDIDPLLIRIYERVSGNKADPLWQPKQDGPFRTFKNIRLAFDETIRDAPLVQWRRQPPGSWSAPDGDIVILEDGNDQFVIWAAGVGGHPVTADGQAIIVAGKCTQEVLDSEQY
jgi:hypothetical protein